MKLVSPSPLKTSVEALVSGKPVFAIMRRYGGDSERVGNGEWLSKVGLHEMLVDSSYSFERPRLYLYHVSPSPLKGPSPFEVDWDWCSSHLVTGDDLVAQFQPVIFPSKDPRDQKLKDFPPPKPMSPIKFSILEKRLEQEAAAGVPIPNNSSFNDSPCVVCTGVCSTCTRPDRNNA